MRRIYNIRQVRVYGIMALTFVLVSMGLLFFERILLRSGYVTLFGYTDRSFVDTRGEDYSDATEVEVNGTIFGTDSVYKATSRIHDYLYNTSSNQKCRKEVPSCILIGVYKCGTRELMDFISMHPNIQIKTNPYEFNYFALDTYGEDGADLKWFRNNMPCIYEDQITMMKHPGYLAHSKCPERIYKFNKDLKMILMVREPVYRFISHVYFDHPHLTYNEVNAFIDTYIIPINQTKNSETGVKPSVSKLANSVEYILAKNVTSRKSSKPKQKSEQTLLKLLQLSVYDEPYERYMKYFKKDQILIVEVEEFKSDPMAVLNKIQDFLNLPRMIPSENIVFNEDKKYYCIKSLEGKPVCYGKRRGRDYKQDISDQAKLKLKSYFRPHNERFFALTGKRYNWTF